MQKKNKPSKKNLSYETDYFEKPHYKSNLHDKHVHDTHIYDVRTDTRNINVKLTNYTPLFDAKKIPSDAKKILATFDGIVQDVKPLSAKQQHELPKIILKLSHALTDERGGRRMGYMNDNAVLAAYTRYFAWWNLVRLVRLFANMPKNALPLSDGDVCLDIGSGPLTVVCALWLSRPELRTKKLTWYCMDISKNALSLGEDIFLAMTAKCAMDTPAKALKKVRATTTFSAPRETTAKCATDATQTSQWQIVRVTGAIGTHIKQKARLITCANMFNEMYQDNGLLTESEIQKYSDMILSYTDADSAAKILVVEPGIPKTARFISLLRDNFLQKKLRVQSPCPHAEKCPMDGYGARKGGTAKWCNFSFDTTNKAEIPANLQKLSDAAELGKYRAVMSFVFAEIPDSQKTNDEPNNNVPKKQLATNSASCGNISEKTDASELKLRVASEAIRLQNGEVGFYACSKIGLVLVINKTNKRFSSGDFLTVSFKSLPTVKNNFQIDKKSGAKILTIYDSVTSAT